MKKLESDSSVGQFITSTTKGHLSRVLGELERKRTEMASLGADYTSGLHDDPSVVRDMQELFGSIDKIKNLLKNSQVLPPRLEIDKVELGNRVEIKFEDDGSQELFRFGTSIDSSFMVDGIPWISIASPLGKELDGKKKGDVVAYKLGENEKKVGILSVGKEN